MRVTYPIPPRTLLRLRKLWPWAKTKGYSVGQIYRVGYYSQCVLEQKHIWLVDKDGEYNWTVDMPFVKKFFDFVELSDEKDISGITREPLKSLRP